MSTTAQDAGRDDPLVAFVHDYLRQHPVSADTQPHGPMSRLGPVTGYRAYREGQFQVEFFTVPPDYVIPAHTHPDVDSVEVYIRGQIRFTHGGRFVFETTSTVTGPDDGSYQWRLLRVRPEDRHGAVTGAEGAMFISIQRWLNGRAPTSVATNYTGPAMDPEHFKLIDSGEPELREQTDLREPDAL
jgi:hypothetical protein